MTLRVDDRAALKRISTEMEDGLTWYLVTNHMFVREKVISGEVKLEWVETNRNVPYTVLPR
jgi:hypothetical protein